MKGKTALAIILLLAIQPTAKALIGLSTDTLVHAILVHQNRDGGFSNTRDIKTTFFSAMTLFELGVQPDCDGIREFIKRFKGENAFYTPSDEFDEQTLFFAAHLYRVCGGDPSELEIDVDYVTEMMERDYADIVDSVDAGKLPLFSLEDMYYSMMLLKTLGISPPIHFYALKDYLEKIIYNPDLYDFHFEIYNTFYASKILQLYGVEPDWKKIADWLAEFYEPVVGLDVENDFYAFVILDRAGNPLADRILDYYADIPEASANTPPDKIYYTVLLAKASGTVSEGVKKRLVNLMFTRYRDGGFNGPSTPIATFVAILALEELGAIDRIDPQTIEQYFRNIPRGPDNKTFLDMLGNASLKILGYHYTVPQVEEIVLPEYDGLRPTLYLYLYAVAAQRLGLLDKLADKVAGLLETARGNGTLYSELLDYYLPSVASTLYASIIYSMIGDGSRAEAALEAAEQSTLEGEGLGVGFEEFFGGWFAGIYSLACKMLGREPNPDVHVLLKTFQSHGTYIYEGASPLALYGIAVSLPYIVPVHVDVKYWRTWDDYVFRGDIFYLYIPDIKECGTLYCLELGNGTRAVFEGWRLHNGTLILADPTGWIRVYEPLHINASWRLQYFVNATGPVEGIGWYDAGRTAKLRVVKTVINKDGVRAVFAGWVVGGKKYPSEEVEIKVDAPVLAKTVWMREYKVEVYSPRGNVSGQGWYREGETVTVKVEPTEIRGDVFTVWCFDGWYVGVSKVSDSPVYTFTAKKPVRLVAGWRREFSPSPIVYLAVAAVLVATVVVAIFWRRSGRKR